MAADSKYVSTFKLKSDNEVTWIVQFHDAEQDAIEFLKHKHNIIDTDENPRITLMEIDEQTGDYIRQNITHTH